MTHLTTGALALEFATATRIEFSILTHTGGMVVWNYSRPHTSDARFTDKAHSESADDLARIVSGHVDVGNLFSLELTTKKVLL